MKDSKSYDRLSGLLLFLGVVEGVRPFINKVLGWDSSFLCLPMYLPSPVWWIASAGVLVFSATLIIWLDVAKKRRFPEKSE